MSEAGKHEKLRHREIASGIVIAASFIGLAALVIYAASIFLLLFAGILFGVFLRSVAKILSRHGRLGIRAAVGITTTVVILIVAGTAAFLAPQISQQVLELRQQIPQLADRLPSGSFLRNPVQQVQAALDDPETRDAVLKQAFGLFSTALGAVVGVIVITVFGIYFAIDPDTYRRGVLALLVDEHREKLRCILDRAGEILSSWLLGRLASMLIVGASTWIGLMLFGISPALTLAVLAFILDFIPNIGPVIAALPAIGLGLLQSTETAVAIAGFYITLQFLESYLITPKIQQKMIQLPPVLVIFAQLLFGVFLGAPGVILATPLVAVLIVAAKELYLEPHVEAHKRMEAALSHRCHACAWTIALKNHADTENDSAKCHT